MASANPPMSPPTLSPEQANAILKPLAAFAKGIANISGSFARASVAPIKSAASFTGRSIKATGGVVRQRIGDAGYVPQLRDAGIRQPCEVGTGEVKHAHISQLLFHPAVRLRRDLAAQHDAAGRWVPRPKLCQSLLVNLGVRAGEDRLDVRAQRGDLRQACRSHARQRRAV